MMLNKVENIRYHNLSAKVEQVENDNKNHVNFTMGTRFMNPSSSLNLWCLCTPKQKEFASNYGLDLSILVDIIWLSRPFVLSQKKLFQLIH